MRRLVANVCVGGTWYGPANPGAPVTEDVAAQITNEAAWEDEGGHESASGGSLPSGYTTAVASAGGESVRTALDEPTAPPSADGLDEMERDDLVALAKARELDVPKRMSRADLIDLLRQQD